MRWACWLEEEAAAAVAVEAGHVAGGNAESEIVTAQAGFDAAAIAIAVAVRSMAAAAAAAAAAWLN